MIMLRRFKVTLAERNLTEVMYIIYFRQLQYFYGRRNKNYVDKI